MKWMGGFVLGWLCALWFSAGWCASNIDAVKAGKVYRCESGDSIWNRKKYLCTEAEFRAAAPTKE